MAIQKVVKSSVSQQVFDQLRQQILSGSWKPGDKLPSENELAAQFGVSRVTVRNALQKLSGLGLLETRFGEGSFIRGPEAGAALNQLVPMVYLGRETLRDKVAEKYEPYIYNALNTASVMIVYGSKPEYFESVWMKNEWTRFLKRMREGLKVDGSLIVAYDGMNPAELPKVFAGRQCLDARKKTFYGDLETLIQPAYTRDCMLRRNRYMVGRSSLLIAVYDGLPGGTRQTLAYALGEGLRVVQIDPTRPDAPAELF